jgi:diacylglycerol kinase
MSAYTVVLLYYQVRMFVNVSTTLTLLWFMSFLPMCIEPINTAVLTLSHYSARTRLVT